MLCVSKESIRLPKATNIAENILCVSALQATKQKQLIYRRDKSRKYQTYARTSRSCEVDDGIWTRKKMSWRHILSFLDNIPVQVRSLDWICIPIQLWQFGLRSHAYQMCHFRPSWHSCPFWTCESLQCVKLFNIWAPNVDMQLWSTDPFSVNSSNNPVRFLLVDLPPQVLRRICVTIHLNKRKNSLYYLPGNKKSKAYFSTCGSWATLCCRYLFWQVASWWANHARTPTIKLFFRYGNICWVSVNTLSTAVMLSAQKSASCKKQALNFAHLYYSLFSQSTRMTLSQRVLKLPSIPLTSIARRHIEVCAAVTMCKRIPEIRHTVIENSCQTEQNLASKRTSEMYFVIWRTIQFCIKRWRQTLTARMRVLFTFSGYFLLCFATSTQSPKSRWMNFPALR